MITGQITFSGSPAEILHTQWVLASKEDELEIWERLYDAVVPRPE